MMQLKAKIILNEKIKGDFFYCLLHTSEIARKALPGQFVNIKIDNALEPLLRRPFSIHRVKRNNIEILYEVVGKATQILSQKKTGGSLDVVGPLGNGFNLKPKTRNLTPILVAGGMGVAPLVFLAEKLAKAKILILLGARTKKQILCEKEFQKYGGDVKIATDDGSCGFRGKVTELLQKTLSTVNCQLSTIYACGPRPMLKEISRISEKCNIPAQISLEEHMACGIGACLGCAVNTKQGYKRVCKEGPVFNAEEILWRC
jgi:dihydroorotate dehydrogenase electron transfer subunit